MIIDIPYWTKGYCQLLYSLLKYCEVNSVPLKIAQNKSLPAGGAILHFDNKRIFLDYADGSNFLNDPSKYDCYFKRSLNKNEYKDTVFPLNFQLNLTYKPYKLLTKFDKTVLFYKKSRQELLRSFDYFNLGKESHVSKSIKKLKNIDTKKDFGRVIYMTRLWNPEVPDDEERCRRTAQNNFRIGACRIIKKEFPNSIVGIFPDKLSEKTAKDVLIDFELTKRENYFKLLAKCDIGVADDGLKDTPGWKIGEYIFSNKAIISTPINTVVENFIENKNYLSTGSRSNFEILPDLIEKLLSGNTISEMQKDNKDWCNQYLEPGIYIENIIKKVNGYNG